MHVISCHIMSCLRWYHSLLLLVCTPYIESPGFSWRVIFWLRWCCWIVLAIFALCDALELFVTCWVLWWGCFGELLYWTKYHNNWAWLWEQSYNNMWLSYATIAANVDCVNIWVVQDSGNTICPCVVFVFNSLSGELSGMVCLQLNLWNENTSLCVGC